MANIPYQYIPNIFSSYSFEDVDKSITWEQRDAPRQEAYYAQKNVSYTYGTGNGKRTYHPNLNKSKLLNEIWFYSEASDTFALNWLFLLFCNRYADQYQHLGWHADDGELIDPAQPIVVISFGAEREIWFKKKPTEDDYYMGFAIGRPLPRPVEKLTLSHGSVLIMPAGFQQKYLHRIPKHSKPCGPRISLTFRGLNNDSRTQST